MQAQVRIRMVFRIPSDLGEPGAGHHDAGRSDGFLVQSVEAGGVHRMGHGKIVSMNDEKLRIRRIAQAFGYSLILRARARSCEKQEHASAGILSKLHEKLKQPSLVANGNMAEAVTKVPRQATGAMVRSPSKESLRRNGAERVSPARTNVRDRGTDGVYTESCTHDVEDN